MRRLLLFAVLALVGCNSLGFETREGRVLLDGALFDYDTSRADLSPDGVLTLRFSDRGESTIVGDEVDLTLVVELPIAELVEEREFSIDGRARFVPADEIYPDEDVVFAETDAHDASLGRVFVNVACDHRSDGEVLQDLTGRVLVAEVTVDTTVLDIRIDGEGIPFAARFAPFEIDGKIELPRVSE